MMKLPLIYYIQYCDLAIVISQMKAFKLLSNNNKSCRSGGKDAVETQHLGNLVFTYHFLTVSPSTGKAVEAAVQWCLPFGCHSPMTYRETDSDETVMQSKEQIPSQSSTVIKMEGASSAVWDARKSILKSKYCAYVSTAKAYYFNISPGMYF